MSHLKKYGAFYGIIIVLITSYLIFKIHPEYFDMILQPSRREVYEREIENHPERAKKWKLLYDLALRDAVVLNDIYSEAISTTSSAPFTSGYLMELALGEKLCVSVPQNNNGILWLMEVRDPENHRLLSDSSLENDQLTLAYTPEQSATVRVVIQARMDMTGKAQLKIHKKPLFGFPLSGKNNAAIQSFWGASRGGGSRIHKGNDLFASRGHPVVAVSNGRVTSVRDRGLGGRQVWIKDNATGFSQYYAHLNSWNITEGKSIVLGDTIGFVGNTGNAKTTPPHLHFGIYKNGRAIDPQPFIWKMDTPEDSPGLPQIERPKASGFAANLRVSPILDSEIIIDLKTEPLKILGHSGNWYHVRTQNGIAGFAHRSIVVEE